MLTFIIPVISRKIAKDYNLVQENLEHTLCSLHNQTSSEWRALVVSQTRPDIDFDAYSNLEFVQAEHAPADPAPAGPLPAMQRALVRRANDIDRIRKLRKGAEALHRFRTDFVMLLEADDLVSNRLVEFVNDHKDANGWYISEGYVWDGASKYIEEDDNFSKQCGSSWIVKVFYETLPESVPLDVNAANLRLVKTGCPFLDFGHRKMQLGMESINKPITELPFRGAIYKRGHGGNLSHAFQPHTQSALLNRLLRGPLKLAGELSYRMQRQPITKEKQLEFGIV